MSVPLKRMLIAALLVSAGLLLPERGSAAEIDFTDREQLARRIRSVLEDAGEGKPRLLSALRFCARERRFVKPGLSLLFQMPFRCFLTVKKNRLVKLADHKAMDREVFVDTLTLACGARETYSWGRAISEEQFLAFVLPYRHTTERVTNWRKFFCQGCPGLPERVAGFSRDYSEAATVAEKSDVFKRLIFFLNTGWLAARVKYAPRGMPAQAPEELLKAGTGRCTDLTNGLVCLCRSFGIAATGLRAIWWPNRDGNHTWASVLNPATGEWMDVEAGVPGEYSQDYFRRYRKAAVAKVYRIVPGQERGDLALAALPGPGESLDPYLDMYLLCRPMVEWTHRFGPVADVSARDLPPEKRAYLCVYNYGGWRPVAVQRSDVWGRTCFKKAGARNVLYLICLVGPGGSIRPLAAQSPFLACPDGTMRKLVGSAEPRDPGRDPAEVNREAEEMFESFARLFRKAVSEKDPDYALVLLQKAKYRLSLLKERYFHTPFYRSKSRLRSVTVSDKSLKGALSPRLCRWNGRKWKACSEVNVSGASVSVMMKPDTLYVIKWGAPGGRPRSTRPFSLGPGGKVVKH